MMKGRGHIAPDADSHTGELRGIGTGLQADGSLALGLAR